MADLLRRISTELSRLDNKEVEQRSSIDTWITDYLLPANVMNYNGYSYGFGNQQGNPNDLIQSYMLGQKTKEIAGTLPAYTAAIQKSPAAFAAECVRASVLSQVRFTFRNRRRTATARRLFGTSELNILDNPWPGAVTGDLISIMEWHVGLAGNSYVTRQPDRLRVLRPDWTAVLYGSQREPDDPTLALDADILGYVYVNGGFSNPKGRPETITPENMCHWYPLPDPLCAGIGMSWMTPAVREMQADIAASEHKLNFFKNGASPNMVVKGLPSQSKKAFDEAVDQLEARHTGLGNAYRTLYLAAGADVTVVGSNLQQMDFATTQGQGETRITALSRVPAIMVGLSEGLKGAALNAGNFGQVRRMFADTWVFPTLQNLSASLANIINVPTDAEQWYDVLDMPILREDALDAAAITQQLATTIGGLVRDGFTPESSVAAATAGDMSLLVPIPGWISVQLQPGGNGAPITPPNVPKTAAPSPANMPSKQSVNKNGGNNNNG